jgi:hypothetical protein
LVNGSWKGSLLGGAQNNEKDVWEEKQMGVRNASDVLGTIV